MENTKHEKIDVPGSGIVMNNSIFIPDNKGLITSNGLRKGTIHYKFNTSPYQAISWSVTDHEFRPELLCKIKSLPDIVFFEKMLASDDKEEYQRLFINLLNLNKTPEENVIKECIIVFTNRKIAVGLRIIGKDIFTVFKSTKLNETKAICKKYCVKTYFDYELVSDLFSYSYLNEIPPHYLLVSIAHKFVKTFIKDKVFINKLSHYFPHLFK